MQIIFSLSCEQTEVMCRFEPIQVALVGTLAI